MLRPAALDGNSGRVKPINPASRHGTVMDDADDQYAIHIDGKRHIIPRMEQKSDNYKYV
jgi:hypothetical protein